MAMRKRHAAAALAFGYCPFAGIGCQALQPRQWFAPKAPPEPYILRDSGVPCFSKGPSFPLHNELPAQIAEEREQGR